MKNKLFLTESEKNRILGLHKVAIRKEFLIEQTQYIKDAAGKVSVLQGPQRVPQGSTPITQQEYETALKTQNLPANQPVAAPTTATPTTPTTTVAPTSKQNDEVLLQGTDLDYDYKKVGDKYYFKLKENPQGPKAKVYKTKGKFKEWELATNQEAIKKISQLPTLSTVAASQAPTNVDGSDETFDAPVQTAGTTTPTTTTPTTTTSSTAATTTNQVKLLDRVPTNKEIRQGFRRRKRVNNRMDRQKRKQLDDLYNQYEQIAGNIQKFGSRDDGSAEFKQQMATLENQVKNINAQIDKLEST